MSKYLVKILQETFNIILYDKHVIQFLENNVNSFSISNSGIYINPNLSDAKILTYVHKYFLNNHHDEMPGACIYCHDNILDNKIHRISSL